VLQAGQELGNYRVIRKIGTGGMGQVYLAEHPIIGKKVALKVVHRDLAARPEVLMRFTKEAKAVGMVAGDHVVAIHDFGATPEGECYYVMDYLEGRTLAHEVASRRPMEVERALYIGAQLAEALGAVHEQGVLHRDLKPDNIMLVPRDGDPDYVMLLDFGLAKFLGEAAQGPKLTAEGMILGTPQYMSPEAAEGKGGVDHRADQYSVGVLLFQMLTGRLPFDGDSMGAILVQQVSKPPPPLRGLNPEVPPAVEQVVLRALAKAPAGRFADMNGLRAALLDPDAYLSGQPPIMPVSALTIDEQATVDRSMPADTDTRKTRGEFVAPHARTTGLEPDAPHARATEPEVTAVDQPAAIADDEQKTLTFDRKSGPRAPAAPSSPAVVVPQPAAPRPESSPAQQPRATQPRPAMAQNKTMGIATPAGYIGLNSPQPRKAWPVVVAIIAVAAVVTAIVALVTLGGGESRPSALETADAAPPAQAARDAAPTTVKLSVISNPPGAEVFDQEGQRLGVTPMECRVPRADEMRTLRLVHPEAVEREKTYDASQDIAIDVELERRRKTRATRKKPADQAKSPKAGSRKDDVLRPSL
jgi:serine/threonine-protein kinase